jgi:SAM-dependent methyltransferase
MSQDLTAKFQLFKQLFPSLRNRGMLRTLHIALYEAWYEWKFRTDTAAIIPVARLDLDDEARDHAQDYFPSSYLFLHEALARGRIDCAGGVFIDYGCGMGRALLFASTLPFRKILGVELSPHLCVMARRNLERYYARIGKSSPEWSVLTADARRFEPPPEASVFYFFNPFDAVVLGEVADRIVASLLRWPRHCVVVYAKPIHEHVFAVRGFARLPESSVDISLLSVPCAPPPAEACRSG